MACLLDQMDIHFDCPFLLSWVVLSRDGAAKFLVVHGGLYGFEFGKRFCGVAKTLNKMKAVRHEGINSLKDIMPSADAQMHVWCSSRFQNTREMSRSVGSWYVSLDSIIRQLSRGSATSSQNLALFVAIPSMLLDDPP
jgi:hypothetical protein